MTPAPPAGIFVAESEIEVRYAETDAMGVVHHGSFVIYLELGRTGYMSQRGNDYSSFESTGHHMAVVELNVRYHRPARYGQTLRMRSWIEDMNRPFHYFSLRHFRFEGRLMPGHRQQSSRVHHAGGPRRHNP